jgi:hypothetical protein
LLTTRNVRPLKSINFLNSVFSIYEIRFFRTLFSKSEGSADTVLKMNGLYLCNKIQEELAHKFTVEHISPYNKG